MSCSLIALLVLVAADLPLDEAIKQEREKLQGTWIGLSASLWKSGRTPRFDDFLILEIISDTIRFSEIDPSESKFKLIPTRESRFTLDPTNDPATIDLAPTTGWNKGKKLRGIYQLDGDELRICVPDEQDGPRPTNFVSIRETDLWLLGRSSQDALKKLVKTLEDERKLSARAYLPAEREAQNLILWYIVAASTVSLVPVWAVLWAALWRFRNQA